MRGRAAILPTLALLAAAAAAALPRPASAQPEVLADCPACPPLVAVPGGELARPGRPSVTVAPFLLGRSEVTFAQWQACVDAGACRGGQHDHGWGRGDRPVINVTAADAEAYAAWLSALTGRPYRLPTEDEWEWAALAGAPAGRPRWGDAPPPPGAVNCRRCGVAPAAGYGTVPATSLPANPWGLHEMEGNLWEWTADCWAEALGAPPPARDCTARVTKGGAWYYNASQSRPELRVRQDAGLWSYTVGFRIARDR